MTGVSLFSMPLIHPALILRRNVVVPEFEISQKKFWGFVKNRKGPKVLIVTVKTGRANGTAIF